jgi:hypothetical protein
LFNVLTEDVTDYIVETVVNDLKEGFDQVVKMATENLSDELL